MPPAPTRASRFQHHTIEVDTLTLHYVELDGNGPPMILLHGIGMDWRVWQGVSRRLQPFFHLYLMDLRGHGESGKPEHGYTLAHYAADVEDFIDALGLSNVTLVGSSLGGMVAATVEAPADIVSHRVLVDPPITGGPVRDRRMFEEIWALKHGSASELARYLQNSNPGISGFLARTMAEMWQNAADGVVQDVLAQPASYFRIEESLPLIEAPTLIMRANRAKGGVLSDEQAQRALALLPHGELRYFPEAGHAIHAYNPDEFADTLVAFAGLQ